MIVWAIGMINVEMPGFTERMALGWVQKYICEFGGDSEKVTMYVKWFLNLKVSAGIIPAGVKVPAQSQYHSTC